MIALRLIALLASEENCPCRIKKIVEFQLERECAADRPLFHTWVMLDHRLVCWKLEGSAGEGHTKVIQYSSWTSSIVGVMLESYVWVILVVVETWHAHSKCLGTYLVSLRKLRS